MIKREKRIISITTLASTMNTFVLESMIQMQQNGWQVTLMCNVTPELKSHVPADITLINIPMQRNFSLMSAICCIYQMVRKFMQIKPSIVQYGTTHAALFGGIASFIAQVPIRIHLQWGIYNYEEMGTIGKFYWFVEWLTCKLSTHIRPVSHKNLKVAVEEKLFKPEKGKVLGHGGTIGVDLSKYPLYKKEELRAEVRIKYNISESSYVFGYIGRLSKDKGNNELIKAFELVENEKDTILLLVGPDEGSIDIGLMEWAKHNPKVVFTNSVLHDEIPHYLAAMDALVHPTYREGFGMVLQEAMAMEVPIITTNIPGPSEVIEDEVSGVLVPSHNTQLLADYMEVFYNNRGKYIQFGKNGRERVEKFFNRQIMINNIIEDKEELYNQYRSK